MGDRGNIVFDMEPAPVYLYTHWGGTYLPETLAAALKSPEGRNRWTDESYLCRITMNQLQGDDRGETGFGIATSPPDNEHPYLVVTGKEVVMIHAGFLAPAITKEDIERSEHRWSFEEFIDGVESGRITKLFRG